MATTEERVSRLEGIYEQVDRRLDDINRSIGALRSEVTNLRNDMNSRFNEVNSRFNEVNSRFNNLYILLLGSWITTMAAIIGLYFKG